MMKIVQITDSHLGAEPGDTLLSMDPDESLCDVLALVKQQQPEIDLVLATGDIANEASAAAYRRFYSLVCDYLPSPFAWLPGNHDKPELMAETVEASDCRVLDLGRWVLILLNSQVSGKIYGNISQAALASLPSLLQAHAGKHVLMSFHHQPVPIGSRWMDNYILQNAEAFWRVIKPY
nr:metallophosphoesterase [Cellvibrionaceae bacterium]